MGMGNDVGYQGSYQPMVLGEGSLNEMRNLLGPPPAEGKKWGMVNLFTGEVKWYQASRRRRSYGRTGSRAYGGPRQW